MGEQKTLTQMLLWSSANPQKISLTIKSFVPFLIVTLAYFNINVSEGSWDEAIEGIVMILTAAGTVWGGVRKIYNLTREFRK